MSKRVSILKEVTVQITIYDVVAPGGYYLDFSAMGDGDGDIRISVTEESMVDYFKKIYDEDEIRELFGL